VPGCIEAPEPGRLAAPEARVDLHFRRRNESGAAYVESRVQHGDLKMEVTDALPSPDRFA
jgi:hypothetical protein